MIKSPTPTGLIYLEHQYGHRPIVLEHQYDLADVMWIRSMLVRNNEKVVVL